MESGSPLFALVAAAPVAEETLVAAAACATLFLLARAFAALRRTTLTAPLLWACAVPPAAVVAAWRPNPFADYVVAVLLLAPTLAHLGAKRPQNGAWQLIVVTLVAVLLLPVAKGWAFGDERPQVHVLFRWVVGFHIFIGVVNYGVTRFAGPALCLGAAQSAAAWGAVFRQESPLSFPLHGASWGMLGFAAGAVWARTVSRRTRERPAGLVRLWSDFCDLFGVVWGLRVAERMNEAARRHGWPIEFAWKRFERRPPEAPLDPETAHRLERELRSLLRRFVDHDWIARRMPPSA